MLSLIQQLKTRGYRVAAPRSTVEAYEERAQIWEVQILKLEREYERRCKVSRPAYDQARREVEKAEATAKAALDALEAARIHSGQCQNAVQDLTPDLRDLRMVLNYMQEEAQSGVDPSRREAYLEEHIAQVKAKLGIDGALGIK